MSQVQGRVKGVPGTNDSGTKAQGGLPGTRGVPGTQGDYGEIRGDRGEIRGKGSGTGGDARYMGTP